MKSVYVFFKRVQAVALSKPAYSLWLVLLMSACQLPQSTVQRIPVPLPKVSVEYQPVCAEASQGMWLSPVDDCIGSASLVGKQLQLGQQVFIVAAQAITRQQWRQGLRPSDAYTLASPDQYFPWLQQGLTQLDRAGVLLQAAVPVLNTPTWTTAFMDDTSLAPLLVNNGYRTQWRQSQQLGLPLQQWRAGFTSQRCDAISKKNLNHQLPLPPVNSGNLHVAMQLAAWVEPSQVQLVKHWLSLDGRLHSKVFTLDKAAGVDIHRYKNRICVTMVDSTFNPVVTAVWWLKVDGQWLSSPLWYTPLKG